MFFGHNLALSVNCNLLSDGVAAGTGDTQTSTVLNLSGDQGAMFIVTLGTVASNGAGLIKVQMSNDNGASDPFTDAAGTGQSYTSANSGHAFVIDVYRPQKQYLQVVIVRTGGGNTTIQSVVAVNYHLGFAPEAPGTSIDGVIYQQNVAPGAA